MIERLKDPVYGNIKELLNHLEIKGVLFDFDDTIIYTAEIFGKYIEQYVRVVGEETKIDEVVLSKRLKEIDNQSYMTLGVNPIRWSSVIDKLKDEFPGQEKSIVDNLSILMSIYQTSPKMRDGARVLLDTLRETGVKMGLVTHANVEWTHKKLDMLGLWNYFETVTIAHEDGHKSKDDWQKAMNGLDLSGSNCLIVGDSLGGDIRPGAELGARTVWIPSPWSVYRQGEVPGNTLVINEVSELLAALEDLR